MEVHFLIFQKFHEKVAHFLGIVAGRKYTAASLHLGGKAIAMEERKEVFIGKGFVGAVEKFPIARGLGNKIHDRRAIRQVAAAFPGDAHLETHLRHFLKEHDLRAFVGRGDGRQKPRHAAADDGDFFICGAHRVS